MPITMLQSVNFGGKRVEPAPLDENGKPAGGFLNRRAELWANMKKALQGRISLPDSDSLQADLISPGYKYASDGRLQLESKEDMRKRGVPSPAEGDAVTLCFADPDGSRAAASIEKSNTRERPMSEKSTRIITQGGMVSAIDGRRNSELRFQAWRCHVALAKTNSDE